MKSMCANSSFIFAGQQAAPVREIIKPATRSNTNNSTTGKKKYAYYNKAEHRLDEPLPAKDPNAAASLEARMKRTGKKMCNHWHLGGHCENGKFCSFQHEPRLNPGELNALRYKTRSTACKDTYCENIECCKYTSLAYANSFLSLVVANL